MPWRPLKNTAHAVCIHRFEPKESDDLALDVGDEVYIVELGGTGDQWCRGWLLAHPSVLAGLTIEHGQFLKPRAYSGIFPTSHVQIREILVDASGNAIDGDNGHVHAEESDAVESAGLLTNGTSNGHTGEPILATRQGNRRLVPQLQPINVSEASRETLRKAAPIPALRIGDPVASAIGEPLVEEISSCIREWHSSKLHDLALNRNYATLEKVSDVVKRLYNARSQLIQNTLTAAELTDLRERTIWDLVHGNKMLDGEVIVRSPGENGRVLTADDDIPEMLRLQALMSLNNKALPRPPLDPHLFHLLVDIKSFPHPHNLEEPALLHLMLYRTTRDGKVRCLTEAFAVELPLSESSSQTILSPEGLKSTLFTGLGKTDVGFGEEPESRLVLVCKLYRDEPLRRVQRETPFQPSYQRSESDGEDGDPSAADNDKRGRRSFFGTQRNSRRSSPERDANGNSRPATRASSRRRSWRLPIETQPATDSSDPLAQVGTVDKKVRRAVGWGAIDVGSLMRHSGHKSMSVALWAPTQPSDLTYSQPQPGDEGWDDILKVLCRTPTGNFVKTRAGTFHVGIQGFAHDNVDAIIREHPALLRDVHCTTALDLVGRRTSPRSDFYLTLREPVLPPNARSFDPNQGTVSINPDLDHRNSQVTLEVRRNDGRRVENAIYPTSNRTPHTAFRTPAVDRSEAWNQTIRIALPQGDVKNAHIVMSIADGPQFPFGLAWLPLWDNELDVCRSGRQNLAVWDYSEYTANTVNGRGAYQGLPSHVDQLQGHGDASTAAIVVDSMLSSTTAVQDGDMHALLRSQDLDVDSTKALLDRFQNISDIEVVKFFTQILNALTHVLEKYCPLDGVKTDSSGREMASAVLKCLVRSFSLMNDRRYADLEVSFREYLEQRKTSAASRLAVIQALRLLLSNPYDPQTSRELRSALKVTHFLIRFVVHATPASQTDFTRSVPAIRNDLFEFVEDLIIMMKNEHQIVIGTQTIIMQQFPSWVHELVAIIDGGEALGIASDMVASCAFGQGQLHVRRLALIDEISKLPDFKTPEIRPSVLENTIEWLEPYWPAVVGADEKSTSAIRMCCSIIKDQQPDLTPSQSRYYVGNLVSAYYNIKTRPNMSVVDLKQDGFSPLFPTIYPFQTITVNSTDLPSEVLLEITSLLGAIFQHGSILHNRSAPMSAEMRAMTVERTLFVLRSMQAGEAFPPSWLSYSIVMSRCQLAMLEWVFRMLKDDLPDENDVADEEDILEFDEDIWTQWFTILLTLVRSPVVVLEHHTDQKRRAIWNIGGDVRETAADLLQRSWTSLGWSVDDGQRDLYAVDRMGGYQVQFTSTLMPSMISIGVGLHFGLRQASIYIVRTMIISEWELSGNLEVVQSAFADAMDVAFRVDQAEGSQALLFLQNLLATFENLREGGAAALYDALRSLLDDTTHLVTLLSRVYHREDSEPASRLIHRVRLLEYLKAANNEDSYLRHIHDISDTQAQAHNFSAAGLALQVHVNMLRSQIVNDDKGPAQAIPVLKEQVELQLPSQTISQRLQTLYSAMIKYYKLGQCWDKALSTIADRIKDYEAVYDSKSLARAHAEQAEIYNLLHSGRGFRVPRYFRVAFGSIGFSDALAGKSFIFEAAPDDSTEKFAQKMREQHPNAMVLSPGFAGVGTAEKPCLRISNVSVNKNQLHPVNLQAGTSPFYRNHQLTTCPSAFSTATRQQAPGVAVADQTVDKTVYTTREQLPTLFGRSEIMKEENRTLTPLEAAIDRTHRKTLDLAETLQSATLAESSEDDSLVRHISASVLPDASDSVAAYRSLTLKSGQSQGTSFLSAKSFSDSEKTEEETSGLQHILRVALEEHARAIEHALSTAFDRRLHVKAQLREWFDGSFEPELMYMYPNGQWRTQSRAWIDPEPELVREQPVEAAALPIAQSAGQQGAENVEGRLSRRPSRRRSSLRKTLSFLNLNKEKA